MGQTKKPNAFPNLQNDQPRIIIPLIGEDGIWFGIQGRSLAPNAKLRYITILFDEDKLKLYGLDTVNKEETIYVTEGPFDSAFITNAVAMCGSDVDLSTMDHQFVFVFDNEPRNRQIVQRIDAAIQKQGEGGNLAKSVTCKDINDMVLQGHKSFWYN